MTSDDDEGDARVQKVSEQDDVLPVVASGTNKVFGLFFMSISLQQCCYNIYM